MSLSGAIYNNPNRAKYNDSQQSKQEWQKSFSTFYMECAAGALTQTFTEYRYIHSMMVTGLS